MNSKELEIFCDASIRKFLDGRIFGCAGAIAPMYKGKSLEIMPDSTNNAAEIEAVYLAVKLTKDLKDAYPEIEKVTIYSDSKISVFGLREWMHRWVNNMRNGILYTDSRTPVANQEIFLKIISFLESNKLEINIRHQKGHVNALNQNSMRNAKRVYEESNKEVIDLQTLSRICWYNDCIDRETRDMLGKIKESDYPPNPFDGELINICYYIPKHESLKFIN